MKKPNQIKQNVKIIRFFVRFFVRFLFNSLPPLLLAVVGPRVRQRRSDVRQRVRAHLEGLPRKDGRHHRSLRRMQSGVGPSFKTFLTKFE